uniref:Uncharacterized protein n=1 Tax=Anguilla anguilla TaxID=7936 RepID=A0A0E9XR19_ANGAN
MVYCLSVTSQSTQSTMTAFNFTSSKWIIIYFRVPLVTCCLVIVTTVTHFF